MERNRIIRVNLMKGKQRREPARKRKPAKPGKIDAEKKNLLLVGIFVMVGVVASLAWDYTLLKQSRSLQSVLQREKRELAILNKRKALAAKIKKELEELRNKERIIKQIIAEAHMPLRVLKKIEEAMPEEVWLEKFSLNSKKISLVGYALNDDVLANFVERLLKEKELVAKVSVRRYERKIINGVPVKQFWGEVVIR